MKSRICHIIVFLVVPLLALAQQAQFYATTSGNKVVKDNVFNVQFTLKNGDGQNFRPPQFDGFRVVSGPNRSMSTTIANGVRSMEMAYRYQLLATKVGRFTIGRATIDVDGTTMKTSPMTVEVVAGKAPEEAGATNVFIKAEVPTQEGWIGQQLLLDYKLYTTVNIESYNVIDESDYQGFFPQDIRRHDSRPQTEVIDGVQYTTKVIKRVALFPQQAGKLTIEPLFVQLGVSKGPQQKGRSLLFNPNVKRMNISTEPLEININPLPTNAPPSFTGAIGKYRVSMRLNRGIITTDDVLSIRMSVQGSGDLKRIQPPPLAAPDAFDVYDPKVLDEGLYETNGELVGKKEFEYLLLPKQPGSYQLQPRFTYFDPDSMQYVTFEDNVYEITVRKGSDKVRQDLNLDGEGDVADIRFLKLDTKVYQQTAPFTGSSVFWGAFVLPFLFLGGVFIRKQSRLKQEQIDPAQRKMQLAQKEALKRLEEAAGFRAAGERKQFYNAVSKAMLGYVCDKLQIPRSELTKDNVRERLESIGVEEARIIRFMDTITTCEMALFAGRDSAEAMQETYDGAAAILADIEAAS
jgi:hypothetical protein